MSKKKSLLFVTTELPWPSDSGGRIKTFRLVQFLSSHFDVNLVCAHGSEDGKTLGTLREKSGVKSVQVFGVFRKRSAFNWFMAVMQFPTFNSFRVYSKRLESMLKWGIQKSDIVIIDHLEMFEMIDVKMVPKVIYHSHNAEFKLWRDYAKLGRNPVVKWLLEWEAKRVKLFERWVIKTSQFTFMAPNDSELAKTELGIKEEKFNLTYHLGNDDLLQGETVNLKQSKKQIFYSGTLSWTPNADGIDWFIDNCWPKVIQSHPDAELVICGKGADQKLKNKLLNTSNVYFKGFVDDLEPLMSESRCAIVPLRFGSGMKIKTFDAMYKGLPIVSTSIGAEGIEVENGKHLLIANDPETFSIQVIQILEDDILATTLAENSRRLAQDKYTYTHIFSLMLAKLKPNNEIQSQDI